MRGRTRIRRDDRTDTSADAEPGGARVVALVVVPMSALVIAPMGALIVAPVDALIVALMDALVIVPMVALIVAPMDALVTVLMDTLVVAPVIAPMDALIVAPMVAVVITPMDALVTAPMPCGAGLLTMISRGRNETNGVITNGVITGLRHTLIIPIICVGLCTSCGILVDVGNVCYICCQPSTSGENTSIAQDMLPKKCKHY